MNRTAAPASIGPLLLLGLAMAGATVLTLEATAGQSIFADELQLFSEYRDWGPGALLEPAGGHLAATLVAAYRGMFELFGAGTYLPNRILHMVLALICAALVFGLARRRVGDRVALAPAVVLLFLGSASEFTATPFGALGYMGVVFGLATLLALERRDRAGDILAGVFLAAGLASYSINIAFWVAAAVLVYLRRRSWWIVLAPGVLYGVWRLSHYEPDRTNISADNVLEVTSSMLTSLAAGCAAIAGLFRVPTVGAPEPTIEWGYPLAAAFIGLVVWRLSRPQPVDPRFWAWLAALLSFWGLVALNLGPLREPEASRYTYVSAAMMLMLLVEIGAGLRWPRWAGPALAAAVGASVLANAVALHQNADQFRVSGQVLSAQLAAIEIARDVADPAAPVVVVEPVPVQRDLIIPIRDYLAAVEDYGSPGYTAVELEQAPEAARAAADGQLIRIVGLATAPVPALPEGCRRLAPTPASAGVSTVTLPPGGMYLRASPGPPVSIAVRRFAGSATPLRGAAGGSTVALSIPPDQSPHPWTATIGARQRVELCAA